ncbi:MAG: helix-turn-helix transcriptional regulator [Eubacteriales bacterium]
MDLFDSRCVEIGLRIAYYRKKKGTTQEQLAEKVDISTGYLSQVETPSVAQPVSLKMLFAFADIFEVPVGKLMEDL